MADGAGLFISPELDDLQEIVRQMFRVATKINLSEFLLAISLYRQVLFFEFI